jgi:O-antigen/teichoic acid export membrane protein
VSEASEPNVSHDSSGEKRRLVTNTLANGLSQSAAMVASLVFMPLLVGAFGLGPYGLYMLASSVTAYAALLDFGAGSALTKMVAEYHAKEDREALAGSVSTTLSFYTVVGVVVALIMVSVGAAVQYLFDVDPRSALLLRNLLWVGAVFQLWYWPASTARYVLAGLQRFDLLSATATLNTVLSIAATVWVLAFDRGPVALVALNGVATAVTATLNVVRARRLLGMPILSYRGASRMYMGAIFLFSWPLFAVQVSDALFYQQTDRVVLGIFAGAAAVGLYEAAAKFNSLLVYLSGLTVSAVLPLASRYGAQERHASLKSLLLRGTKYAAALVAPITVVLLVFAEPLIADWLGPTFNGQAPVAQVLIFPHILVCLGLMGDAIVISQGRLAGRIPYIVAQAILNVVLSVALVGRYGVMGVAIGTAISHLVDFPLHMRFLFKETGTRFGEWLRHVVAPVYPLLLVPLLIAVAFSQTALMKSVAGIAAASAVAVFVYWTALYLVALTGDEKGDVRSWLRALRRRLSRRVAD